jgi:hypothetical protein
MITCNHLILDMQCSGSMRLHASVCTESTHQQLELQYCIYTVAVLKMQMYTAYYQYTASLQRMHACNTSVWRL